MGRTEGTRACFRHVLCVTCSALHCSCTYYIIRYHGGWVMVVELMCFSLFFLILTTDWVGGRIAFGLQFAVCVLCCLYLMGAVFLRCGDGRRQSGHYDDEQFFFVSFRRPDMIGQGPSPTSGIIGWFCPWAVVLSQSSWLVFCVLRGQYICWFTFQS